MNNPGDDGDKYFTGHDRVPVVPPESAPLFAFGIPALMTILYLAWLKVNHGKFNRVFVAATLLYLVALPIPFRMIFAGTQIWHQLVASIAP